MTLKEQHILPLSRFVSEVVVLHQLRVREVRVGLGKRITGLTKKLTKINYFDDTFTKLRMRTCKKVKKTDGLEQRSACLWTWFKNVFF